MAKEEKRFYWIKLKENFFDLETIDWLISQKNGCEYVVLYQKLCLLTANKNGEMVTKIGEMIIPYDVNKIARDTKMNIDTVVVAMELFTKLGLIYEQQDGVLKIPYVDEIVGSETSSAQRMREHRAKKALRESVTKLQQSDDKVTQEIRDKSIDNRDKIIDKDKDNNQWSVELYQCYEKNIGTITEYIADDIDGYVADGIEPEMIKEAIKVSAMNNVRNWKYIKAIIDNKINQGIKTLDAFKLNEQIWQEKKANKAKTEKVKKSKFNNYEDTNKPDYSNFSENILKDMLGE